MAQNRHDIQTLRTEHEEEMQAKYGPGNPQYYPRLAGGYQAILDSADVLLSCYERQIEELQTRIKDKEQTLEAIRKDLNLKRYCWYNDHIETRQGTCAICYEDLTEPIDTEAEAEAIGVRA